MIGGAAINRPYAHRTSLRRGNRPYEAGVFYAKDAFEGLSLMDRIIRPEERSNWSSRPSPIRVKAMAAPLATSFHAPAESQATDGKTVREVEPPTAPFLGVREMNGFGWPTSGITWISRRCIGCIGAARGSRMKRGNTCSTTNSSRGWRGWNGKRKRPAGSRRVYAIGFFPANSDGNDLIVFDPDQPDRGKLRRFTFPRQPARERLCLADYFLPVSSGKRDIVGFQLVTWANSDRAHGPTCKRPGNTPRASSRTGWGFVGGRRRRIRAPADSDGARDRARNGQTLLVGLSRLPGLSQHAVVAKLLDPAAIGVSITDGFQFDPEQSTAAISCPIRTPSITPWLAPAEPIRNRFER